MQDKLFDVETSYPFLLEKAFKRIVYQDALWDNYDTPGELLLHVNWSAGETNYYRSISEEAYQALSDGELAAKTWAEASEESRLIVCNKFYDKIGGGNFSE